MPKISNLKKEKISEHILSVLLDNYPEPVFTAHIAQEIARDEEFIKKMLNDLKDKELITFIDKNPKGIKYTRRSRWRLSNKAYSAYSGNTFNNLKDNPINRE
ncbi:hypothetical protein J4477_01880 [Candidatus Pacearchaeota archaeon]|nr:hypothetical protein [Candidatus Pacearchaeota archaeon]